MSRAHISGRHANLVAKILAEKKVKEGFEELKARGIFQEVGDGIIKTDDEILEEQWPFETRSLRGFEMPEKFGVGGLVYSSDAPQICPVDITTDIDDGNMFDEEMFEKDWCRDYV